MALIATALATPLLAQRAELERRVKRMTLPNGLEVIAVENFGVPLVTIEANVRNGSFTQDSTFEGLAHLYEHMFFKANTAYPEPDAFVSRASELGAVFNGTTEEERVNYYLTVPADSVAPGMRFLADALMNPLFLRDELERERQVVIGEYDQKESSPFFRFNRTMGQALWSTAWSRKNPLGERAVILRTTPEQMRTIQRKYYIPNNTALIIAGAVSSDSAFALARRLFSKWDRGQEPFPAGAIPPVPPLTHDTALIVDEPIGGAFMMMQWQGPRARGDVAATYAADVFSDVLNQPTSRFQRKLVDSGLWQGVGVNYYTLNEVGPITISGQADPARLKQAMAALEEELRHVTEPGYFSEAELETARQQRIAGTMFGLERASGFAHLVGFWWAVTGLDYYYGYVDTMAKQSAEDLRRYARTYIIGKPRVVGVMLPADAHQALRLVPADLLPKITP